MQAKEGEIAGLRVALASREQELVKERGAGSAAREEVAGLRAQMHAEGTAAEERLRALLDVEKNLKASFEAMAANALDANSKRLLGMTQAEMGRQKAEASQELAAKKSAIELLLKPMQESLERLSSHSQQLEVKREGAYQAVLAEIQNIQRSHTDLRRETTQLVTALRSPKVRGNWGEMQLRRCVEFSGMLQHASFEVEKFVRGEEVSIRPDLIVKLPNGRSIIVDAKTPLDAFMDASACEDEVQRTVHLAAHAERVRKHLDALSGKAYWKQFAESPDFVVCFLPSEVLFSAALEHDPSLLEHSAGSNVLLATPTTLIALLKAVAYGWQQSQIARDAEQIREAAINVHAKLAGMHGAFLELGNRLRKAGECYDDVLVKAEGRGGLFSIARKLRDLKIGERDLADSKPTALKLRPMQGDEWQPGLSLAAVSDEREDERSISAD
ncbi:MAG: DNA recombination protein RmuC [Acidobacteriaceae bacterium]